MQDVRALTKFAEAVDSPAPATLDSPIGESVGAVFSAKRAFSAPQNVGCQIVDHLYQLLTHVLLKNWYETYTITISIKCPST